MVDIPAAASSSSSSTSEEDRRVKSRPSSSPAQSVHPHPFSRALSFLGTQDFLHAIGACKVWREARGFKTAWPSVPQTEEECIKAQLPHSVFSDEPPFRPALPTCRLLEFDLDSPAALPNIIALSTHPCWQHAMTIRCEWFAPSRAADSKAEEKSNQCLRALSELNHLTSLDLRDLVPTPEVTREAFVAMKKLRTVHLDLAAVVPILPSVAGLRVLTLRLSQSTKDAEVAASIVQLMNLVELTLHSQDSGIYEKDNQDRAFSLTHALSVRELSLKGSLKRFRLAGMATQLAFRGLALTPRRHTENPPGCTTKGTVVDEKYFSMPPAALTSLKRDGVNTYAEQLSGDVRSTMYLPHLKELQSAWNVDTWMLPAAPGMHDGTTEQTACDRDPLQHAFRDAVQPDHKTAVTETLGRLTRLRVGVQSVLGALHMLSTLAPQLQYLHLFNGNRYHFQTNEEAAEYDPVDMCIKRLTQLRELHFGDLQLPSLPKEDWSCFFGMGQLEVLEVPAPEVLHPVGHLSGLASLPHFCRLILRDPELAKFRFTEEHLLQWAKSTEQKWLNVTVWGKAKFALTPESNLSAATIARHQLSPKHLARLRFDLVTGLRPPHPRKVYALVEDRVGGGWKWEQEIA
jgi:hypothetical protein